MTPAQIGREMARERGRELRRAAERHRLAQTAAGAEARSRERVAVERASRWLVRVVGAAIRL